MSSGLNNRDCLPILGSSAEVFENPQNQLQAVILVSANKIEVTQFMTNLPYYYHYSVTIFLPADVTGTHELFLPQSALAGGFIWVRIWS